MMKRNRPRQPGKGTLMIVAAFLLGSAMIRIGGSAGQAFANQPDFQEIDDAKMAPEMSQSCSESEDLAPLLAEFQKRQKRIESREQAISERMKALTIAEEEVNRKLSELKQAETQLRDMVAIADQAAENDISRLISVYENMKPKDAAALFEEMTPEFAAGFLGRMQPQAAAGIMAGLSPQSAYSVSAVMAGRNAHLKTD